MSIACKDFCTMAINLDKANDSIKEWTTGSHTALVAEIVNQGIRHRTNSPSKKAAVQSLQEKFRNAGGLISRVSFQIPRHMIFVHKGVGKGVPISKVGQTTRRAKAWFNPVIDKRIDDLADRVAEEYGEAIMNNLLIK